MTPRKARASAIYCRLSQDRTGESLGIERQEQLCRQLASEKRWTVAEVYVDPDISAYSGKRRPAYERLLDDLKNGVRDAVVVVDQDRLTRTPRELEAFIDLADANGIALASVSGEVDLSTSDGRFRARIMGTVARQESEKKSERLRRQRDQAARLGKFQGGPRRYGYEPDGITIRRDEAKVIREIARRLLNGESMRSVVLDLNARGIPSANGSVWGVSVLKHIITSPRLAGLRAHHGDVVGEAEWKPILDRETHERLRALLIDGKAPARGRPSSSLLGGIAVCARCGARLHQTRQRGLRVYRCSQQVLSIGKCGGVIVQADALDALVSDSVLHRIDTKAVRNALTRKPRRANAGPKPDELAEIDADLEALATDFGAGRISRREWLAAREQLDRRRQTAVASMPHETNNGAARLVAAGSDVRKAWKNATIEQRRAVIQQLVEKLSVGLTGTPGSNAFDPDRVDVVWRV
jgi:DNA invertase Pin-like site-specific DNA recombinase